ncbi:MAG TPA: hypothetical protein VK841_00770 [Polyangiaceae bacterium]|nr:hypothetical protein [Polyangiaceae bacterium]
MNDATAIALSTATTYGALRGLVRRDLRGHLRNEGDRIRLDWLL